MLCSLQVRDAIPDLVGGMNFERCLLRINLALALHRFGCLACGALRLEACEEKIRASLQERKRALQESVQQARENEVLQVASAAVPALLSVDLGFVLRSIKFDSLDLAECRFCSLL